MSPPTAYEVVIIQTGRGLATFVGHCESPSWTRQSEAQLRWVFASHRHERDDVRPRGRVCPISRDDGHLHEDSVAY